MKFTPVLIAAVLGSGAVGALAAQPAADQGFYLSGGWGQAQADMDNASVDASLRAAGVTSSVTSSDDRVSAWKFALGYQFNRHFALEAGYADFDGFSTTTTTTGPAATIAGEVDGKAYSLDLVGILPVNPSFDLYAKVGVHYWDVEARRAAVVGGTTVAAVNASDDGSDWKFGLGARWNLSRNFGIQLEWERYNGVGESNTTGSSDIDMVTLGVRYRF